MYGMIFLFCNLLQITLVAGLLLPFLHIHVLLSINVLKRKTKKEQTQHKHK